MCQKHFQFPIYFQLEAQPRSGASLFAAAHSSILYYTGITHIFSTCFSFFTLFASRPTPHGPTKCRAPPWNALPCRRRASLSAGGHRKLPCRSFTKIYVSFFVFWFVAQIRGTAQETAGRRPVSALHPPDCVRQGKTVPHPSAAAEKPLPRPGKRLSIWFKRSGKTLRRFPAWCPDSNGSARTYSPACPC